MSRLCILRDCFQLDKCSEAHLCVFNSVTIMARQRGTTLSESGFGNNDNNCLWDLFRVVYGIFMGFVDNNIFF